MLVSSTNSSIIKTKHKCYITHHGKVTAKLAIILQPLPPCAQNICNFAFLLQTSTWHKYSQICKHVNTRLSSKQTAMKAVNVFCLLLSTSH